MSTVPHKVRLIARVLSIVYTAFLSLFALDVFTEYSGLEIVTPLFIHLIPSIILFIITVIAWRYPLVGAVVYCGFAMFYVWDIGFSRPISWYLTIALPSFIVGIFYLFSYLSDRKQVTYRM